MSNGAKTSEFKVTLLAQLVGAALVSLGIISPLDIDQVTQHLMIVIGGISTVITSALYIYSRYKLKDKRLEVELAKTIG